MKAPKPATSWWPSWKVILFLLLGCFCFPMYAGLITENVNEHGFFTIHDRTIFESRGSMIISCNPPTNISSIMNKLGNTLRTFENHCTLAQDKLNIRCSSLTVALKYKAAPIISELETLQTPNRKKRNVENFFETVADFFGLLGHKLIYGELDQQVEDLQQSLAKELEGLAKQMKSMTAHENDVTRALNQADQLLKEQADKWEINQDQGFAHRELLNTYQLIIAYLDQIADIIENHREVDEKILSDVDINHHLEIIKNEVPQYTTPAIKKREMRKLLVVSTIVQDGLLHVQIGYPLVAKEALAEITLIPTIQNRHTIEAPTRPLHVDVRNLRYITDSIVTPIDDDAAIVKNGVVQKATSPGTPCALQAYLRIPINISGDLQQPQTS